MREFLLASVLALLAMPSPASRLVQGTIVDAETGRPVPGAIVTAGERTTAADAAGHFSLEAQQGRVAGRAPGYRAAACTEAELASAHGILRLTPFTPRGLYLSVYGIGSGQLRSSALGLIRQGFANALVIDVKGDRGIIPYPTQVPLGHSPGARAITTVPDLGAMVSSLHREGIYAIARIVVFKDNPLATARPDLAVHRSDGGLYRDDEDLAWTDPFNPEVRAYNIAIAREAAQAGFDEIQFDYVRFPDVAASLRFSRRPDEAGRTAAIEAFLREARQQLVPFNVFLAIDVFGYICWNTGDTGIGQQLENLAGLVDYLSPMLYPSSFQYGIPLDPNPIAHPDNIVRRTLENAQRRVKLPAKRFRPWIQGFRDYAFDRRIFGPGEVRLQIQAAESWGSNGWMLWNPRNVYTNSFPAPAAPSGSL